MGETEKETEPDIEREGESKRGREIEGERESGCCETDRETDTQRHRENKKIIKERNIDR